MTTFTIDREDNITAHGAGRGSQIRAVNLDYGAGSERISIGPLTHGSRRADFDSRPVSARLLHNADRALPHLHRSTNRSF